MIRMAIFRSRSLRRAGPKPRPPSAATEGGKWMPPATRAAASRVEERWAQSTSLPELEALRAS